MKRPRRDHLSELRINAGGLTPQLRKNQTPEKDFQGLFHDVQLRRINADSKTFVDAVPLKRRQAILKAYEKQRDQPGFDLMDFVADHFTLPSAGATLVEETNDHDMSGHITSLWRSLERKTHKKTGSLLEVPYPYVVPGGRFNELFYWDSYFVMLGLAADGRIDLVESIIKNFAYMLRKYGYIPTANRSYLTTRSQPPYFAKMIQLLAVYRGQRVILTYLPYLLAEYRFWMKGSKTIRPEQTALRRVVRMPDGTFLNRYYDNSDDPRPESYPEDIETAEQAVERQAAQVYLDVRAAAESGWDFSSRWLGDSHNLSTIQTTNLAPVDLNSLLYELELLIARGYTIMKQKRLAATFHQAAEQRAATMRKYCWDEKRQFFFDFNIETGERSAHQTLAATQPLLAGLATPAQAKAVALHLKDSFLKPGGLVSTLVHSGQQWDAPNGWAPLQLIAIYGLRRYGINSLANEIKKNWLRCNELIYNDRHKMVEKYDVLHPGAAAAGGEYALQDGFGWTNGVAQTLIKEDERVNRAILGQ